MSIRFSLKHNCMSYWRSESTFGWHVSKKVNTKIICEIGKKIFEQYDYKKIMSMELIHKCLCNLCCHQTSSRLVC